jgi:hypothetical protein
MSEHKLAMRHPERFNTTKERLAEKREQTKYGHLIEA